MGPAFGIPVKPGDDSGVLAGRQVLQRSGRRAARRSASPAALPRGSTATGPAVVYFTTSLLLPTLACTLPAWSVA
jgi:hypothetical protein